MTSDHAVDLRKCIIDCCTHVFMGIMLGNGDAKWRLGRGLGEAQRHVRPDQEEDTDGLD